MLRYLTHKLRAQSLTETDTYHDKTDDDRDSGTESDDEGADIEELQKYMETIIRLDESRSKSDRRKSHPEEVTKSCETKEISRSGSASDGGNNHLTTMCLNKSSSSSSSSSSRRRHSQNSRASRDTVGGDDPPESPIPALDSALPSDSDHNFDHHSSEEELEVINGEEELTSIECNHRVIANGHHHHHHHHHFHPRNEGGPVLERSTRRTIVQPEKRKWSQTNSKLTADGHDVSFSSDDDDEVRDLMMVTWCGDSVETLPPVQFRTSPPANVHKPRKCLSPPPKVFHLASVVGGHLPTHELCSVSPRKRHRKTTASTTTTTAVVLDRHIQRPCLDFEKMQQINRVRLV